MRKFIILGGYEPYTIEAEDKVVVIDRKPVPIYETECGECHSIIQYRASEVSLGMFITCPVCGKSVNAFLLSPVRMEDTNG